MSPCSRRTQLPSFRSIAGNKIIRNAALELRGPNYGVQLRGPSQEVRDQREAELLAFLGMELRADDIVTPDHRGDRATIFGLRNDVALVLRVELIRMHEIGVQALRPERNAGKHRMT